MEKFIMFRKTCYLYNSNPLISIGFIFDITSKMEKEFQYILSMVKKCEQPKFVCIPTYLSYVKCRLIYLGYRHTEFTGVLTIYTGK